MRRYRRNGASIFGSSFLDVLANTIGGLAFLLVMAALLMNSRLPSLILTESLPVAIAHAPYSLQLAAKGGAGEYFWRIEGDEPEGLTITPEGLLQGVVGEEGSHTVRVALSAGQDFEQIEEVRELTLDAVGIESPPPPLRVLTRSVPDAVQQRPYQLQLAVHGGVAPYRWKQLSGPEWASTTPDGRIELSPPEVGDYSFRWEVRDRNERVARSATVGLHVLPPLRPAVNLELRTRSIPSTRQGEPFDLTLAVLGGTPPYVWTADDLPDGVEVEGDRLTGAPAVAGDIAVTLRVEDEEGSTQSQRLSWKIEPPLLDLSVLTDSAPLSRTGSDYSLTLAGEGGLMPYRWEVASGELPPGLALDGQRISGSPARPGMFEAILRLEDARGARLLLRNLCDSMS